jgi:hypothetical protein
MWDILGVIATLTSVVGVFLLTSWLLNRRYYSNQR